MKIPFFYQDSYKMTSRQSRNFLRMEELDLDIPRATATEAPLVAKVVDVNNSFFLPLEGKPRQVRKMGAATYLEAMSEEEAIDVILNGGEDVKMTNAHPLYPTDENYILIGNLPSMMAAYEENEKEYEDFKNNTNIQPKSSKESRVKRMKEIVNDTLIVDGRFYRKCPEIVWNVVKGHPVTIGLGFSLGKGYFAERKEPSSFKTFSFALDDLDGAIRMAAMLSQEPISVTGKVKVKDGVDFLYPAYL